MTFEQKQAQSRNIRNRAERLSQAIRAHAIAISAAKLGPNDGCCFLMAHNWQGQSWMSPEQNQAARHILYLEEQSYVPSRMADRIIARIWN